MNIRTAIITLGLVLATAFAQSAARADEKDQATKLTFNQSFQIPGRVLPAGTYWFMRADFAGLDGGLVQIFSADRSTLYATVITITSLRTKDIDKTALTFGQQDSSRPQALLTWFYQGRCDGHEFLYSSQERKELARDKQATVVAGD
jgi:hypothetical protein